MPKIVNRVSIKEILYLLGVLSLMVALFIPAVRAAREASKSQALKVDRTLNRDYTPSDSDHRHIIWRLDQIEKKLDSIKR